MDGSQARSSAGLQGSTEIQQRPEARDQRLFVDHSRPMPEGAALLKTRRKMRYEDAASLWFQLKSCGWTIAEPAWGADIDP